ncbi:MULTISPECIES: porin [Burkholderia]|uniref:Putative porin n=1 Tax=Burkholderia pyrrocinia TaxID=60550 RepID=A0A318HXP4_BURPY|nr:MULTISPECIES: porin [Burkholderia]PXX23092.1 putative porin [Burkholderia pyrrocinia]SFW88743.1 Outer membrane protein (porin) [Burkholderia sp. NFACC33-1]SFY46172.1 Outer membrane protein (porin) [Burkholderia sp. NFPP32]
MQKSLRGTTTVLTLALATTTGMAHAQSSVALYGLADAFVGELHPAGALGSAWQVGSGGMTTSYWGMSGSEDLGGGLKAVFTLESFFRMNGGQIGSFNGQAFFGRNAFVGLGGHFGELTLGRNTAPLFVSTLLFNPFVNSFVFSPIVVHSNLGSAMGSASLQSDTAIDNSVLYQTPEVGGLSGSVLYSNAGVAGHVGQANYSANVLYFAGPFSATAAVQSLHTASLFLNGATAQTAWLIGSAYRFRAIKVFAQYERVDNNNHVTDDTVQVGASIRTGIGSVLVSWAGTQRRPAAGDHIHWSTAALGYDYPLSKRTDMYAAWRYDTISHVSSGNSVGAGIRMKF